MAAPRDGDEARYGAFDPGKRLADEHPEMTVTCLDDEVCPCVTMARIDAPHLAWVLEEAVAGRVRNQITVDPETSRWALVALERMLEIT